MTQSAPALLSTELTAVDQAWIELLVDELQLNNDMQILDTLAGWS
jgi:hypothetical protein